METNPTLRSEEKGGTRNGVGVTGKVLITKSDPVQSSELVLNKSVVLA